MINKPRFTPTQAEAVETLRLMPPGHWHSWRYGFGKYNVALRALMHRYPAGLVERKIDEITTMEMWRLVE